MPAQLHSYRCKVCGTVASATFKSEYGVPLRCNLCRSFMTWLYAEPITTPEQDALARKGVVYNPAQAYQPTEPIRCENPGCTGWYSHLFGLELAGVGKFCSAKCADVAVRRHEAAMNPEPESGVANG